MASKLIRFSPGIEIKEAATWLSKLIGEKVGENDFLDFSIDGYLQIGLCGPLMGIQVNPPEPEAKTAEWLIAKAPNNSAPDRLHSSALYEPIKIINTEIGEAPAYLVDGVIYAWFNQPYHYEKELDLNELIETLVKIDLDGQICVHPEDILRIAELANSTKSSADIAGQIRNNRVISISETEDTVFHNATPITGHHSREMRTAPTKQIRDSTTQYSVIGILLELLSQSSRSGLNQSAVINEILEKHADKRGLSKRNLEAIFSSANKILKGTD